MHFEGSMNPCSWVMVTNIWLYTVVCFITGMLWPVTFCVGPIRWQWDWPSIAVVGFSLVYGHAAENRHTMPPVIGRHSASIIQNRVRGYASKPLFLFVRLLHLLLPVFSNVILILIKNYYCKKVLVLCWMQPLCSPWGWCPLIACRDHRVRLTCVLWFCASASCEGIVTWRILRGYPMVSSHVTAFEMFSLQDERISGS